MMPRESATACRPFCFPELTKEAMRIFPLLSNYPDGCTPFHGRKFKLHRVAVFRSMENLSLAKKRKIGERISERGRNTDSCSGYGSGSRYLPRNQASKVRKEKVSLAVYESEIRGDCRWRVEFHFTFHAEDFQEFLRHFL